MKIAKVEIRAEKEINPGLIWNNALVDVSEVIKRQPIALSIGETEYKGSIYPIAFGSYGDYSCIVGSSKSRKSFFKSALIAAYIGGESDKYFPNIKTHRKEDKLVIDIDTEQSRYHSQRAFKRVIEMVGSPYGNYYTFSLRRYTPNERMQFIEWIFMDSPYKNDIGFVSIDGYADLLNDFNNLEESTQLTSNLLKWSAMANCHITGVLHKNFGSEKPVGHLGSSVLKKAETVVFMEKDENESKVICKYSRNLSFEEFRLRVNQLWLPELSDEIF